MQDFVFCFEKIMHVYKKGLLHRKSNENQRYIFRIMCQAFFLICAPVTDAKIIVISKLRKKLLLFE